MSTIEFTTGDFPTPLSILGPYRAADYLSLPEGERCELLYGRLYASPSPIPRHQFASAIIYELFLSVARRTGGARMFAPMDVQLAEHSIVQPDVILIRADQLQIITERRIVGAPALLVEVGSPGTFRRDRGEKLRLYAEAGVAEYWLVDPDGEQIEFLVNDAGRFIVTLPQDGVYVSTAEPELRLDVAAYWAELAARLRTR